MGSSHKKMHVFSGESQKSYLSARATSSSTKRATSAGEDSVIVEPPSSSAEDLKVAVGSQDDFDQNGILSPASCENNNKEANENELDNPEKIDNEHGGVKEINRNEESKDEDAEELGKVFTYVCSYFSLILNFCTRIHCKL